MKWTWRWIWFGKFQPPTPPAEGQQAHQRALDKVADIDNRWDEVHTASDELRRFRHENHFADNILKIFGHH